MATASENQPKPAAEAPLEPDLPICDPHHHLRERPNDRYFLEEFIRDTGTGHNIVATVCVENRAMYRKDGPETMKPIGETEFFDSVAAQAAADPNNSDSCRGRHCRTCESKSGRGGGSGARGASGG